MTIEDRENRFIERCRAEFGGQLSFESEMLLRYGFSVGARELERDAYADGVDDQRARVLGALGATSAIQVVRP